MSKTALILVDIQNDYFTGGKWPVDGMARAADNAARVLTKARTDGTKVVHIRHEIPVQDAPFFEPGTSGADIHAAVAPIGDEPVITKFFPNSFRDTPLLQQLRDDNVTAVVIIGAMSQMCIQGTARAACDFGFDVQVVHDACAARAVTFEQVDVPAAQVHAAMMGALSGTYAEMVSTDSFCA